MKQTMTGLILPLLATMARAARVEIVRAVADCVNMLSDSGATLKHDDTGRAIYARMSNLRSVHQPQVNELAFTRLC